MKRNSILAMLLAAVGFVMTGCSDDETGGLSKITYYPTIELLGDNPMAVAKGSVFTEPGFVSKMNGADVSDQVVVSGSVDTGNTGYYTLKYTTAKNEDGFGASTTRRIAVVDTSSPYEGLYLTSAEGYRIREGNEVKYGASYPVLIIDNGDGTVEVDDLLGGWYRDRAGYGSDYALAGTLAIADDGTVTCVESYLEGWGDSHQDFTGTYDAETGTLTVKTTYADMEFIQTWVKKVIE